MTDDNNYNNDDNTNRDDVLERLSLLESQLASLHKQLTSQSNKRDNNGKNLVDIELDGDTQNSSLEYQSYSTEDVFRIGEGKDRRDQFRDDFANHVNENARQPRSFRWNNSFFTTRTHADDDYKALSEDTFTMMIMSKPCSKQWWYAFIIFLVQITLLTMILQDQSSYDYVTTPFDVPYKVSAAVHAGQLLAIVISLATQTDLVIAIITFIMLWSRRRISWTTVAEVAENSHPAIWTLRIAFPLCCKFVEGVLVLLTTFVIVIQSDSMIELFKDFAAMQLISELDNMMFWLSLHGYAGTDLMEGAKRAQKIRIKDDVVKSFCGIPLRTIVLVALFLVMFSGWVYVVIGQVSGVFFYMKFPHCNITEDLIPRMGNQICDGGALNSIGCNFDDNDCLAFNIAYPGCKVVDSYMIGDGHCDPLFNTIDCGFDGGDCCPVHGDERLGDGICDGYIFNTEACNWDNGDCISFNKEFPSCQVKIEWQHTTIELYKEFLRIESSRFALSDGICQGLRIYRNPECGWEGGDCKECQEKFQDQIAQDETFLDSFADGHCDGSSILNIDICSFDGGDCLLCMEENIDNHLFNASLLGDGHCDGGAYMSSACQYDSHDCDEFLNEYPSCEAESPDTLGDGTCDSINDYFECDFDGGDCTAYREKLGLTDCFVDNIHRVGDGICDGGEYVTESCNFDGGDCDNCAGQVIFIGDGLCDGGTYMNSDCGFDGGDCDDCTASDIMMVGDGVCDEKYNNYDCYYDGGDCVGLIDDDGTTNDDDPTYYDDATR